MGQAAVVTASDFNDGMLALRMQQSPQPVYTEKAVVRRGTGLGPHVHAAVRFGLGFESSSCVRSN